jgi:hypothetical protein
MRYGAIYIAHNPRDGDSIFKVGKTERSVEERMSELTSATSNLGKYSAYASFVVFDVDSAEYACHRRLRRYRVQENREFFEISLPRLLKIVAEEIERYSARDHVPEIDVEGTPDLEQKSAIEMLKLAREQRNEVDQSWDKVLANATDVIIRWSAEIREKVSVAAAELSSEKTLRWEISGYSEVNQDRSHYATVCSVTVCSHFIKKPLELWRSGIQGGIYGDLDLSRAIDEPEFKSTGVDEKSQFVKWKELDDGRIGRISLMAHLENAAPFNKERGELAVPKLIVRATPIRYDNYHQDFEEKYHSEKSFTDPNEAVEVFLSIVIDNIKVPQHDVRELRGTYRNRFGESRKKILDVGKFEIGLLEDRDWLLED